MQVKAKFSVQLCGRLPLILQCTGAEQSQQMMTQRLAATEEQLASQRHDALAAQLAAIKLTLAQSEFHVLQLQVRHLPSASVPSRGSRPDDSIIWHVLLTSVITTIEQVIYSFQPVDDRPLSSMRSCTRFNGRTGIELSGLGRGMMMMMITLALSKRTHHFSHPNWFRSPLRRTHHFSHLSWFCSLRRAI